MTLTVLAIRQHRGKPQTGVDRPGPAWSYPLPLLRPPLLVYCRFLILFSFRLCMLLSSLYAVELECAEEANAQGYWYRLPLDLGAFEG